MPSKAAQKTEIDGSRWSEATWRAFHAESAARSARATALVTVLCSLLLFAWAPGDFEYFPEHAVRFTYYRLATVVWCSAMAVAALKLRRTNAKFFAMWLWFLAWAAESSAMIPATPDHLLSHTFVMVMAQLGSLGFMVWSWRWGLTMSLALVGIGQLALLRIPTEGYEVFAAEGYLLSGFALCTLFTAVKHGGAREQFDQTVRLQVEKERSESFLRQVASMRQERLTWLEKLASFLRHELKNQVVAVSTSLELADPSSLDEKTERYVSRAQRSLGRMRRLVESATEATSLEAAMATEETGAVELSAVVEERVALFRDVHGERQFLGDIESEIVIDGNEDRLAQLLDKLLENAVDHGGADGEIQVSLKRANGGVSLRVENEGDALPANREGLFDAFVTVGERGPDASNVGLGLFVAKAIAESHGGTIDARALPDGSGACFEVCLPLA
ncbi:MAG: sensor histidine kinase [Polyangiales bacterium]